MLLPSINPKTNTKTNISTILTCSLRKFLGLPMATVFEGGRWLRMIVEWGVWGVGGVAVSKKRRPREVERSE